MSLETWTAFLLASAVLLAIPGPTVLLVVGQALGAGRRNALPLVAGVALGDLTAMTLSLAGLGAVMAASATAFAVLKWAGAAYLVMAASATAFAVLKWAGAAYLVWLGLRLWRAPVPAGAPAPLAARRALRDAYVVTALNPKGIAFFVAFVPQFVAADAAFLPQAAVLVATFVLLAAANAALYAALAGRLSGAVTRPSVRRGLNRLGGAMLMGAGAATAAAMRRA